MTTQTANITVEAWISWEGTAGTPLIVYNGNSGTNGFGLMISDGRCAPGELLIVLNGGVACNAAGSAGVVPRGVWQHVAATRSAGGVWTIYVNGEQRATGLTTAPKPAISGGTSVGAAFEDNDYNHFRGRIDEVAVYDRALSAERIRAHYEATGRSAGGVPFPQTF